jgi:hypothetical protein
LTASDECGILGAKEDAVYTIVRTEREIVDLLNNCIEADDMGTTKFRAMTYEQGMLAAIRWLTEPTEEHPLED